MRGGKGGEGGEGGAGLRGRVPTSWLLPHPPDTGTAPPPGPVPRQFTSPRCPPRLRVCVWGGGGGAVTTQKFVCQKWPKTNSPFGQVHRLPPQNPGQGRGSGVQLLPLSPSTRPGRPTGGKARGAAATRHGVRPGRRLFPRRRCGIRRARPSPPRVAPDHPLHPRPIGLLSKGKGRGRG